MTSIRHLRLLNALIECGSVSAAAETVGITQPAASKALANLQKNAGFQIYKKQNNRLYLTQAGRIYCEEADRLVRMANDFEGIVSDIRERNAQRIRLATTHTIFSSDVLSQSLFAFSKENPNVQFEIEAMSRVNIIRAAESDHADLVIAYGPVRSPNVVACTFGTSRLCAIAKRDLWLRDVKVLTPAQFAEMPAIMFFPRSRHREMVDQFMENSGTRSKIVAEVANASATLSLASVGLGVGICDELYIRNANTQDLDIRPLGGDIKLNIEFVQRNHAEPSAHVSKLREIFESNWRDWQRFSDFGR